MLRAVRNGNRDHVIFQTTQQTKFSLIILFIKNVF